MRKILFLCFAFMFVLSGMVNAEDAGQQRTQMLKDARDLNSSLTFERISAMQSISTSNSPDLLNEFKIIDKLKEIANDSRFFLPVRRQALQTLVSLNANGIAIPRLLELLSSIIDTGKDMSQDLRLKIIALDLMIDVASATNTPGVVNPEYDRVFVTLKNLWAKKTKMPLALQIAMLEAIGGFGDKKEAVAILTSNINSTNEDIVVATIRALQNAIVQTGVYDRKLMDDIAKRMVNGKTSAMRVSTLNVLQALYDNGLLVEAPNRLWKPSSKVIEVVTKMLKEGNDIEVPSAVRFLMRISGQDPSVSASLLEVAKPNPKRLLSYDTLKTVNGALIDVMLNIANGSKANIQKHKKEIDDIINHMISFLNPADKDKIPVDLRRMMIMGLGCVPKDVDRTVVVQTLIALLANEAAEAAPSPIIIGEAEDALTALTAVQPFRIVTIVPVENTGTGVNTGDLKVEKVVTPDIEKWNAWFKENSKNLVAGKEPFSN